MENKSQSEIEVRFWPFKLTARGERAIAAVRWPLALVMIAVAIVITSMAFLRSGIPL